MHKVVQVVTADFVVLAAWTVPVDCFDEWPFADACNTTVMRVTAVVVALATWTTDSCSRGVPTILYGFVGARSYGWERAS